MIKYDCRNPECDREIFPTSGDVVLTHEGRVYHTPRCLHEDMDRRKSDGESYSLVNASELEEFEPYLLE